MPQAATVLAGCFRRTYLPARAPAQEGWAGQEAVSKQAPELPKALPAPSAHRPVHTQGFSRATGYTHESLGSSRHKCCLAGSVLGDRRSSRRCSLTAGAVSPEKPPRHGCGPKLDGALTQPRTNPALKTCAARRVAS